LEGAKADCKSTAEVHIVGLEAHCKQITGLEAHCKQIADSWAGAPLQLGETGLTHSECNPQQKKKTTANAKSPKKTRKEVKRISANS
jgi:hypothetical protein